jgi:AcrR family transcriptional regulator
VTGWLGDERAQLAAQKILDAAAELFVEKGVSGVGMGEIARAAGCSRATLYRYFADRGQLHIAFVHREAIRVGELVAAEVRGIDDPAERVTTAVLAAVRQVRSAPTLAAWFRDGDAGLSADLAQSSAVIEALGLSVVADAASARWLVRVIVSLLTVPGRDDADERAMVERFVVPVVYGAADRSLSSSGPAASSRKRS